MNITHISEHNPFDLDSHSGLAHWITLGLIRENIRMRYIYEDYGRFRQSNCLKLIYKKYRMDTWLTQAEYLANKISDSLRTLNTDAILITLTPVAAAALETDIPIIYRADATYSGLAGFYPSFLINSPDEYLHNQIVTEACLRKAKLLIFSTHWAARTAIDYYGIPQDKIRVVTYGANLDIVHTLKDVQRMIKNRSKQCIKFLFVGKSWFRKGGDIVLKIAKELHVNGYSVEVTIVGCIPDEKLIPSYVKCEDFISKRDKPGLNQLDRLYRETHFLFVPSRAEAFGIVFCEANAYGVPCLSTSVGGIPETVRDGINGKTFALEATVKEYCDYIINLISNYSEYEELALSAYNEYVTRLNWQVASQLTKQYISEVI